jgi:hypothetical protein
MYRNLLTFALTACLLLANGCASTKKKQEQIAKAEAVETAAVEAAPTPEAKLGVLVTKYPELLQKPTKVVRKTDTIFVKETTAAAALPPVSTPQTDTALVKDVLDKLAAAGQQVTKAQANALQHGLAPILRSRPKYSTDTARTQQNGLDIMAWIDGAGIVQIRASKQAQHLPYPSVTYEVRPQPVVYIQPTWYQKLWLQVKAYFWLAILLIVLLFIYLLKRLFSK